MYTMWIGPEYIQRHNNTFESKHFRMLNRCCSREFVRIEAKLSLLLNQWWRTNHRNESLYGVRQSLFCRVVAGIVLGWTVVMHFMVRRGWTVTWYGWKGERKCDMEVLLWWLCERLRLEEIGWLMFFKVWCWKMKRRIGRWWWSKKYE